ncbi:hypothetical protein LPJ74_000052 [Coemansia sp. RSA 1843]|nr:hypothetical protein LPJ74_000052 [Coemansia sp. RSA 1843]
MSQSKVDCHFFMTGTCRNGDSCSFRHSAGARDTHEICPLFAETGECPQDDCGKRHTEKSAGRATKPPSEVPCRNEENGGACTRADCIFKHSRPHSGVAQQKGRAPAAKEIGTAAAVGRPMFRPTHRMSPAVGNSSLNTKAKVFVPQMKPQNRPKTFGNMEWTPAMPTNRPTWPRPNMPSASNQQPAWPQSFNSTNSVFAQRDGASISSSIESDGMDIDSAQTSQFAQPAKQLKQSTEPLTQWKQPVEPATAQWKQPVEPTTTQWKQPANQFSNGALSAQQTKEREPAPASIPTIYDILGITEDINNTNREDRGRSNRMAKPPVSYSEPTYIPKSIASNEKSANVCATKSATTADVPLEIPKIPTKEFSLENDDGSSENNSPTSRVCYASEFASYVVGEDEDEEKRGGVEEEEEEEDLPTDLLIIEDVTNKSAAQATTPVEVVRPTQITTPAPEDPLSIVKEPVPMPDTSGAQKEAAKSRPKPKQVASGNNKDQGLPKILSFQEIMERKRRKKAAEAEAGAEALASPTAQQTEESVEGSSPFVGKRRASDDDGMESDASEGKRMKPTTEETPARQPAPRRQTTPSHVNSYAATPKTKNYVAMFERELEDLSLGLSGPLQNSPASDRISRANINDTYIDTDLSQLLGS